MKSLLEVSLFAPKKTRLTFENQILKTQFRVIYSTQHKFIPLMSNVQYLTQREATAVRVMDNAQV